MRQPPTSLDEAAYSRKRGRVRGWKRYNSTRGEYWEEEMSQKNKREKKYSNFFNTQFRMSINMKPTLLNTKEDTIPVTRHSFRLTTAH